MKRVSLGYFARNNLGDILTALTTELSTLELQSMKMVDAVINGYIQVAVILLCVAIFCPPAALVALAGVLVSAFALRGIGRLSARTAPVGHRAQEALSGAAIEYIHGKLVEERDAGKAILLVSLELDEVMQLSDRILVIYEGRIVADLDPKTVTVQELGLYMAGSGRRAVQ